MWTYSISTGVMQLDDVLLRGYSGAGFTRADGRNNPDMVAEVGRGPIPPGLYKIGEPHSSPHTGPYTMNLDPEPGTNTFGRDAFRIHGNNAANNASHGCIILPPDARRCIWDSGDRELQVIA